MNKTTLQGFDSLRGDIYIIYKISNQDVQKT